MQVFISVEEARSLILDTISVQESTRVALDESLGRTLAVDIESKESIPPFNNSGMDGYAVVSEDFQSIPVTLEVLDEIPAGAVSEVVVKPGTCSKIMTGAPMPAGADSVAPVEWVIEDNKTHVSFGKAPVFGSNVRKAGQDVEAGEIVIRQGKTVTPPVVGMLATLGYATVDVVIPPTIAVIATGDELIAPGESLTPGKIRNSSGYALSSQVRACGGNVIPPLLARDNKESIRRTVEQALAADVLVFAGGVSVGDYDLVKNVLDDMGMEMLFWKVRQRPGKPLAYGILHGKPVFGLPGNPVSSAICFDQYVRPAIYTMLGHRERLRPRVKARLSKDTPKVKGLHFFARGIGFYDESNRLCVHDTGPQGSNLYSSMVKANCIIHLEEEWEEASAGTEVNIEWITW